MSRTRFRQRLHPTLPDPTAQQRISEQGLLLLQFFPDMPPSRKTFPMRNALMSAYGIASIIVRQGNIRAHAS